MHARALFIARMPTHHVWRRSLCVVAAGLASSVVFAAGELTAYSMVTHDGRRLVSRSENGRTVYELVATNALPAGLPPVRQWTIYGIKSAHSDLGLHRSNYAQRKGTVRRLEIAKEIFDADRRPDDDPAAFRYVQEGWWGWFNFIDDRGEAKARADSSGRYIRCVNCGRSGMSRDGLPNLSTIPASRAP